MSVDHCGRCCTFFFFFLFSFSLTEFLGKERGLRVEGKERGGLTVAHVCCHGDSGAVTMQ